MDWGSNESGHRSMKQCDMKQTRDGWEIHSSLFAGTKMLTSGQHASIPELFDRRTKQAHAQMHKSDHRLKIQNNDNHH